MKANRLAGHELPNEGRIRDANKWLINGPGRARCSCGLRSPKLPSTSKRKQWHRDHKNDIRSELGLAQMDRADAGRQAPEETP